MKGCKAVVEALKSAGVTEIFAYPGASVLPIFNELYDSDINTVVCTGEQGCIFAADGYARASGKAGVVLATSGPGATNLVTGLANAFMDSVPLVVITGNVGLDNLGRDSFQEVDTTGIAMPVTKYSYIVKRTEDLYSSVKEAFDIALHGRKGPVLVDIPQNLLDEKTKTVERKAIGLKPFFSDMSRLDEMAKLINDAKNPVIYVGGGVIQAGVTDEVIKLAEKLNAPVATSLMGIGGFPSGHPLSIGASVKYNALPQRALSEADLLITLGARFASKATYLAYNEGLKLAHIDIDHAELDKIMTADAYLINDLRVALPALNKLISQRDVKPLSIKEINKNDTLAWPLKVLKCVNDVLGNNQIVTTDVGLHQLWTAFGYKFNCPRSFLTSGGLGAMGFGLPAAVGAAIATGKKVLAVTGDGSFDMDFNELITAVRLKLDVVVLLFNNNALGMIREEQRHHYRRRYIASTLNNKTDYPALARALGANAVTLKDENDLPKLAQALKYKTPVVIEVITPIDSPLD